MWTLSKKKVDKTKGFKIWICRELERRTFIDKVSNKEAQNKMKTSRTLLLTILKEKGDWIRHIIRGKRILTAMNEVKFKGKRGRGW